MILPKHLNDFLVENSYSFFLDGGNLIVKVDSHKNTIPLKRELIKYNFIHTGTEILGFTKDEFFNHQWVN